MAQANSNTGGTAPTLVVLAAGMGSRYGGIKQIEPVSAAGDIIIDYSVFDAIKAGFGKIVFVIRKDIEAEFRSHIGDRVAKQVAVAYVFQDKNDLPAGFTLPADRSKPWGTAHAVRTARSEVNGPFAVINADDFYGSAAFAVIADFLRSAQPANSHAIAGYILRNTVSEHGTVSRGVCITDNERRLTGITEHTKIAVEAAGTIVSTLGDGSRVTFSGDEWVSMNFFGFQSSIFAAIEEGFVRFLTASGTDPKAEFFIPLVANDIVATKAGSITVLPCSAQWFGITYKEDRPMVVASIQQLIDRGDYPSPVFAR